MKPKTVDIKALKKPVCRGAEFPLFVASIEMAIENLSDGDIFVEIGTACSVKGSTCILQCLHSFGIERYKLYSIDHERSNVDRIKRNYNRMLNSFERKVNAELILKRSQSRETQTNVKGQIAWLYIDGCHCYECVFCDIRDWVPRVKVGGILGFHDTNLNFWGGQSRPCLNRKGEKALWGVLPAIFVHKNTVLANFDLIEEVVGRSGGMRFYRRSK